MRKKKPGGRRTFLNSFIRLTASLFVIMLVVIPFMIILIFHEKSKPLPSPSRPSAMVMLDMNGAPLPAAKGTGGQLYMPLGQISPWLIQATVAIEDRRFWRHWGIDWKGLLRAVIVNLQNGKAVQGGSTITQQLARNLYLTHQKTWSRKWEEASLALRLESRYNKKQILEQYLNHIYYGNGCYGAESAARYYFGKSASELTLAESSLLAGIPKGPTHYAPDRNPQRAQKRQQQILTAMMDNGMISRNEKNNINALTMPVWAEMSSNSSGSGPKNPETGAFRTFVNRKLDDLQSDRLDIEPLTVKTTLDPAMQSWANQVIREELPIPNVDSGTLPKQKPPVLQAVLIAVDPRSGAVRALIGGHPDHPGDWNRATMMRRQPGSTFKPIVYLTALGQNWTAATFLRSEPTMFIYDQGRQIYKPENFGKKYPDQEINMRQAIAASDNIYAVKTLMAAGPESVIGTARSLGIDSPLSPVPSLALGSFPLRPIELLKAYAAIANGGKVNEPYAIEQILAGSVEKFRHQPPSLKSDQKMAGRLQADSFILTQMMRSVLEEGGTAARVSHFLKRPAAVKTGTTSTDAWMAGFTPELAVVVWIGYDRNQLLSLTDARKAAVIFARFLEGALKHVPPKPFETGQPLVQPVYIDPVSGKRAGIGCASSKLEWFRDGTEPVTYCGKPVHDHRQSSNHPANAQDQTGTATDQAPQPGQTWWKTIRRWWISD